MAGSSHINRLWLISIFISATPAFRSAFRLARRFDVSSKSAVGRRGRNPNVRVSAGALGDNTSLAKGDNGKGPWVDLSSVRLVITGTIPSTDFVKLMNAAEDPVGITGDQSFIESVYLDKVPWYETMAWKHGFYNGFKSGIASAKTAEFMTSSNADNLTAFMDMAPQEPDMDTGVDEWESNRTVRVRHVRDAVKEVAFFFNKKESLKKAVVGTKDWMTMNKNVKKWLQQQLAERIAWNTVFKRTEKVFKVLLFMENYIGFGNTILLQRIESELNTIEFKTSAGNTYRPSVRCVVTTMDPEPQSEATPEKIQERHPEWLVPVGDRETQLEFLVREADSFQPDIAIVAPASSYDWDVRPELFNKLQAEPHRPVLWLGEYDHGETAEESGFSQKMWALGLGQDSAGIVVPTRLQEKLESPWVSDIAETLASVKLSKRYILLFAYLHTEDAIRDYLLLAKRFSKVSGKEVVVVMPRMKCVPKDEVAHAHQYRNMDAMLQRLIRINGPFGGSLKVIRAEKGDSILQWNDKNEACDSLRKMDVVSPQIAISSAKELRAALGLED